MTDESHLADLGPEDRGLLFGLPYRVGVWMSHADDEGGEEDDIREMKALEKAIKSMAGSDDAPAFVREVLQETLSHKDNWDRWAHQSFDILSDCEKAVAILRDNVTVADRKNYKKLLVNIARKVAGAYGEFGEGYEDKGNFLGRMLEAITDKIQGHETDQTFANISPAEDAALHRLIRTLNKGEDDE